MTILEEGPPLIFLKGDQSQHMSAYFQWKILDCEKQMTTNAICDSTLQCTFVY